MKFRNDRLIELQQTIGIVDEFSIIFGPWLWAANISADNREPMLLDATNVINLTRLDWL